MKKPDFSDLLRRNGLKATHGRIALLEALWREAKPVSAPRLARMLVRDMNEVSLYRTLEKLVAADVITRTALGSALAHYEFEKKHHHHLVCTKCESVEDVALCVPPLLEKKVLAHSRAFERISSHSLEFFGVCRACARPA
jgi:Fe2+ or Zn2+ uptake regulation protein